MPKTYYLKILLDLPIYDAFEYSYEADLPPERGLRVKVPLGRKEKIGIIWKLSTVCGYASDKLKSVLAVIDEAPLISEMSWAFLEKAADYYHAPLGEMVMTALPKLLRGEGPALVKKARAFTWPSQGQDPLILNTEQAAALAAIQASSEFKVSLLEGITGSGKTEIYLQCVEAVLARGQQVLVLVPEIALTGQTVARFEARFPKATMALHSQLSERLRADTWLLAAQGQIPLVIGTRSAIFTPFKNLGLVIIDEFHDLSYKQQEGVRYSGVDLGILRAKMQNFPVVLGSATPSLEVLHHAREGRYQWLRLTQRAGGAAPPELRLLDLRKQKLVEGLSEALLQSIATTLARGEQVLLFLNRRGFAPVWMCHDCGWLAKCSSCSAPLTLHRSEGRLRCHRCDLALPLMHTCPGCRSRALLAIGVGTQRLEDALLARFPEVPVIRVDRDSTRRKTALSEKFEIVNQGKPCILLGTQMLAKGHHFPKITLVGLVEVDGGFFSSDFRAMERMGQLILQVAGRSGRAEHPGLVLLQTHQPHHPCFLPLLAQDYLAFAESLLSERKSLGLPPFSFLALMRVESANFQKAETWLKQAKTAALALSASVDILGPLPAPIAKSQNRYRWQILFLATHRAQLHPFLKAFIPCLKPLSGLRWSIDVDPQEMM